MTKNREFSYENILPSKKNLESTKLRFHDENDIRNSSKTEDIIDFAKKVNLFFFILVTLFSINIFSNLIQISLLKKIDKSNIKLSNTPRGKILDRNGTIIATNLPTYDLYIDTRKTINKKKVKENISRIFRQKKTGFLNFVFSKDHYILIQNNLKQFEINELKKIGDPGIFFQKSQKRIYPQHNLFCHITGFISKFYIPKSKLEKNLNTTLNNGKDVKLSLDLRIQTIVHQELKESVKEYEANSGLALVMNVNNGEILSMVSLPDFDPNYPESIADFSENNLVTEGRYEMGSTLKMFNAAMAYEYESTGIKKIFDTEKPYQITPQKKITDEIKGQKQINFDDIFIKSSNIGSIKLLEEIGVEKQKKFFQLIGLTKDLNLSGLSVVSNKLPPYWNDTAGKFISFGYGISLSPISLASSFSSLVNGGKKIQPTISIVKNFDHKNLIRKDTSKKINNLLKKIVENGTGKKARVAGVNVGGKTGTSKKWIDGNYSEQKVITSFIGVFPIEEPKYITLVLFDEPKRKNDLYLENFGGNTAAPTFSRIIKKISPILNKENYLSNM